MKLEIELLTLFHKARDFARAENYDLAIKYYDQIIEATKDATEQDNADLIKNLPRVYYHKGWSLVAIDKFDEATATLAEMRSRFSNLEFGAGLSWIDGLEKLLNSASEFEKDRQDTSKEKLKNDK